MSKRVAQDDEFESYQNTILRFYKDHTHEEVQIFMETQHGFKLTKTQYENAFRRWQNKKNLSQDDWKLISNRIEELGDQRNLPKVYICGASEPLSDSKVRKGISRHGHQTTLEKVKLAKYPPPRAVTPPYIRISTLPLLSSAESAIEEVPSKQVVLKARLSIETFREWARHTPCWQLVDFMEICIRNGTSLYLHFPHDPEDVTARSFAHKMMQDVFFATFIEPAIYGTRSSALSWHQPNDFLPPSPADTGEAIDTSRDFDLTTPCIQLEFLKLVVMLLANRHDYDVTGELAADNVVRMLHDKHNLWTFRSLLQNGLLSVHAAAEKLLAPAVKQGHLELVSMVVDSGADINIRLRHGGWCPKYVLQYAIKSGRDDMVNFLLRQGADPEVILDRYDMHSIELRRGGARYYSILDYTVLYGSPNMLCDILKSRARSEATEFDVVSQSLKLAIRVNRLEMFDWLMISTNSFAAFKALGGRLFGDVIARAHISTVSALVYRGFNISCRDFSILPNAVNLGRSPEFIRSLLEMGANVDGIGTDSRSIDDYRLEPGKLYAHKMTALHCALHRNDIKLVRLLLDYGADTNKLCASVAPIQVAAAFSDTVAMAMLLEVGTIVQPKVGASLQHDRSWLPMLGWRDLACLNAFELGLRRGRKDIVDMLLRSGASLDGSATQDLLYSTLVGRNRELVGMVLKAKSRHMLTSSVIEGFLQLDEWDALIQMIDEGTFFIESPAVSAVNTKVIKAAVRQGCNGFIRYILSPSNIFGRISYGIAHAGAIFAIQYHDREMLKLFLDLGYQLFTPLEVKVHKELRREEQHISKLLPFVTDTLLIRVARSFIRPEMHTRPIGDRSYPAYKRKNFESSQRILALLVEHCRGPLQNIKAENERKQALAEAIAFLVCSLLYEAPKLIQILSAAGMHLVEAENFLPCSLLQLALANSHNYYPRERSRVVEFLLDSEIRVTTPAPASFKGCYVGLHTVVHYASGIHSPDLVKRLLDRGADVDDAVASFDGTTALEVAVIEGDTSTAELLLEHHVQLGTVPTSDRYESELRVAVEYGRADCIKLLLKYGAQVNAACGTHQGSTALQSAVKKNDAETVKVLIAYGANVNAAPDAMRGGTALHFAAIYGHFTILYMLLQAGASVNAPPADYDGRTAIEGAAEHGRLDIVRYLLAAGAHVQGREHQNYRRTVYRAWTEGHRTLVRMLQDFKAIEFGPQDCETEDEIVRSMTSDILDFASEEARKNFWAKDGAASEAEEAESEAESEAELEAEREAALYPEWVKQQWCTTVLSNDDCLMVMEWRSYSPYDTPDQRG